MTRPRSGRSRPRAATSVATQTRAWPSRRACSASLRSRWLSSPESGDGIEAALAQGGVQVAHGFARVRRTPARARGIVEAQHVDDGALDVARRDADGAVFDVAVRLGRAGRCRCAGRRAGSAWRAWRCRAAMVAENSSVRRVVRRGVEDDFEVLAEAEVEHLVGFVEHGDAQVGEVEIACARGGRAGGRACRRRCGRRAASWRCSRARVHAADAGDDRAPVSA